MIKIIKNIFIDNKIIALTFILSIACYVAYVLFRGFGWDGDSFISASQFQKLIGSDLYGTIDNAAYPKLLSVLLFGIVYQLSGGFYLLTIIAILLNALMITTLVSWVNQEKGIWLIALFGLLINIPWTKIVVNCDNPAFSIPFIIFGLYYVSKDKFILGTIFFTISNLFRPGAEFVLIFIFIIQLFNKNFKNVLILGIGLAVSIIHTYWGHLIIYPSKELLWNLLGYTQITNISITKYKYSPIALIPYISSIIKQSLSKYSILFIIPFIAGVIKLLRKQNSVKLLFFSPLESLIMPLGLFAYGLYNIKAYQHMGYTIVLPVIAAFSINRSFLEKIGFKTKMIFTSAILISVVLFSVFTGNLKRGDYEAHVDGTGKIGWTNFPRLKNEVMLIFPSEKLNILTAHQYLTFVILDIGKFANNIDVVRNKTEIDYSITAKYDLIVLPKAWELDSNRMSDLGYVKKININKSFIYYISKSTQL